MSNSDFWAAVAQIVPVVALALVLEARVWGRRVGRRKRRQYASLKGFRTVWGISMFLAAASLVWVLLLALKHLRRDSTSAVDEVVATVALGLSFAFVALTPVLLIAQALLVDVHNSMPWSSKSRAARKAVREEREAEELARWATSRSLDMWMRLSEGQVRNARNRREAYMLSPRARDFALRSYDEFDADIDELRGDLAQLRVMINDESGTAAERRARAVEAIRDVDVARRVLRQVSSE